MATLSHYGSATSNTDYQHDSSLVSLPQLVTAHSSFHAHTMSYNYTIALHVKHAMLKTNEISVRVVLLLRHLW